MKECPKCGYQRQPKDDSIFDTTECPNCRVIYARVELALAIVLLIEGCLLEDASVPPEDVPNWNKTDEKKFLTEVGSIYVFVVHRDCQSSYPDTYSPILTEFHHLLKKNELGHLINGADYYTQLWNESEEMYWKLGGGADGFNPISRMCHKATGRCSLQKSVMAGPRIGIYHGGFTKGLAELFLSYPEAMMKRQDIPKNYVSRTKSQLAQEQSRCEKCGHYDFQYDGYWKEYVCKNCGWTIK